MPHTVGMEKDLTTFINALEYALEVPLREEDIKRIAIDMQLVERLYWNLKEFHQKNRVEIDRSLFRPNLNFVGFGQGAMCRTDFDGFNDGDFLPRVGSLTIEMDWIKSTLLFSDEVVIEDPVFALCRWLLVGPTGIPNLSLLEENLIAFCQLRPLIAARILRVTSFFPEPIRGAENNIKFNDDGSLTIGNVSAVTKYQNQAAVQMALAAIGERLDVDVKSKEWANEYLNLPDEEDFSWLYIQSESMLLARDDGVPFQPFLYGDYQTSLFKKLLLVAPDTYMGDLVRCEELSTINSYCGSVASDVRFEDLISIRQNEEVFERWRETLRAGNNLTRDYVKTGFAGEKIFAQQMQEAQRQWKSDIKRAKQGFLGSVTDEGNSICVGAVGAVLGAIFTGGNPMGAAAGAAGGSAIGVLLKTLSQAERYEAEKAAATFFMTFNPELPDS